MSLNIKNEEAAELTRELAEMTGETVTAAVTEALREQLGRGSGHPARLDFGDCFAYALAKDSGEPLLSKGGDFAQTDVKVA